MDLLSKVTAKILRCLSHGCLLGWLIDPKDRSVLVFFGAPCSGSLQDRPPVIFDQQSPDPLPVPDFAASFKLTVGQLFGWLLE